MRQAYITGRINQNSRRLSVSKRMPCARRHTHSSGVNATPGFNLSEWAVVHFSAYERLSASEKLCAKHPSGIVPNCSVIRFDPPTSPQRFTSVKCRSSCRMSWGPGCAPAPWCTHKQYNGKRFPDFALSEQAPLGGHNTCYGRYPSIIAW